MGQLLGMIFKEDFLFSIIRITAPILFAGLGSVISERAGESNIGLEGMMSISALIGVLVSYWTQNWFLGVLSAIACGCLLGLMMGFFNLKLKTDIILCGIAVNMLGGGGTIMMLYMFTGMRGNTGSLMSANILIPTINIKARKAHARHLLEVGSGVVASDWDQSGLATRGRALEAIMVAEESDCEFLTGYALALTGETVSCCRRRRPSWSYNLRRSARRSTASRPAAGSRPLYRLRTRTRSLPRLVFRDGATSRLAELT